MARQHGFNKPAFQKRLGKQISKLRRSRGYSMDQLALEGGFSRATMSRIESGQRDPWASTLFRIAEVLDVPLAKLLDVKLR